MNTENGMAGRNTYGCWKCEDDLQRGKMEVRLPRQQMIRNEWIRFVKFSVIVIVAFLLLLYVGTLDEPDFHWYLAFGCGALMIMSIPVEALRIWVRRKRCPGSISKNGAHLFFDGKHFSVSEIDQICLTDADAVSKSIYPLNRYIRIAARGKRYKYWLGSAGCLSREAYREICEGIEELFTWNPSRVVYRNK